LTPVKQGGIDSLTMISFRAGLMAPELRRRARPGEVGAIAKRDLQRYYWLVQVALAGAPPVTPPALQILLERSRAALGADTAERDLSAAVYACAEALPGWSALQLLALADALERIHRRRNTVTLADLQQLPGTWHSPDSPGVTSPPSPDPDSPSPPARKRTVTP